MAIKVKWLSDVAPHDYRAALRYLTLRLDEGRARKRVKALRKVGLQWFRANDILRAADLDPAPLDDPGVVRDLEKIRLREKLSPVLLVNLHVGLDVADGYHRVSACYHLDPDTLVPGRLTA